MTDRDAHVAWCKARALEYVALDDLPAAVASMTSDLGKHEACAPTAAEARDGFQAALDGPEAVRRWINSF